MISLPDEIKKNPEPFQVVQIPDSDSLIKMDILLGETPLDFGEGDVFDGFRFTVPEGQKGKDFIWFTSIPPHWFHWYILPLDEQDKPGFEVYFPPVKLYKSDNRVRLRSHPRIFQTLDADYFTEGHSYVIWFRRTQPMMVDSKVNFRFAFAERPDEGWKHDHLEKILKLEPQPAKKQMNRFGSRGAKALLDKQLFDPAYGKNAASVLISQIEELTTNPRSRGHLERTFQVAQTQPSLKQIQEKLGKEDFFRSARESALLKESGSPLFRPGVEEALDTYYYDFFGFQVSPDDPEQRVVRVVSHGLSFQVFPRKAASHRLVMLDSINLAMFYDNGKEIGRIYHLNDTRHKTVAIQDPPPGIYKRKGMQYDFKGDGILEFNVFYPSGNPRETLRLQDHLLHGECTSYFPDGQVAIQSHYQNGKLHGKHTQYAFPGAEPRVQMYGEGNQVPLAEAITP